MLGHVYENTLRQNKITDNRSKSKKRNKITLNLVKYATILKLSILAHSIVPYVVYLTLLRERLYLIGFCLLSLS